MTAKVLQKMTSYDISLTSKAITPVASTPRGRLTWKHLTSRMFMQYREVIACPVCVYGHWWTMDNASWLIKFFPKRILSQLCLVSVHSHPPPITQYLCLKCSLSASIPDPKIQKSKSIRQRLCEKALELRNRQNSFQHTGNLIFQWGPLGGVQVPIFPQFISVCSFVPCAKKSENLWFCSLKIWS